MHGQEFLGPWQESLPLWRREGRQKGASPRQGRAERRNPGAELTVDHRPPAQSGDEAVIDEAENAG